MTLADELVPAGPTRQAAALRAGEVTSRQLTIATLAAVTRENAALNAITTLLADDALDAADAADARRAAGQDGPLLGVPIVVKDDLDLAGTVTSLGSNAMTHPEDHDSALVAALRLEGMPIVAKATLPELAIFGFTESDRFGITRNPYGLDHTPGGSSGGSAALVAAGAVGIATASDGAGSIRIPAACCGLVGFKPSHGTMPSSGGWHGLSTQGGLARRVADSALFLDTFGTFGSSLVDAAAADPQPLRIGLSFSASAATRAEKLDPAVEAAVRGVAKILADLGHTVSEVQVPYGTDAKLLTVRYLAGIRDTAYATDDPARLERRTKGIARLGRPLGDKLIDRAKAAGASFGAGLHDRLGVDVLLTPVMSGPAVKVGRWKGKGAIRTILSMNAFYPYTAQWNHAGVPAVSMPVGVNEAGLPLAAQLIAAAGDDARLMSLAAQLERTLAP